MFCLILYKTKKTNLDNLRLTFHHEQVGQVLLGLPLVGMATLLECLVVVVVGGGQLLERGLVECSCFVRSREIRALKHHGHQIYTRKCTI